ncbi:RNase E specificity factor CsrD [Shewanella sp. SW36]|uniref:RNase E specificity factor CsrD n=1 Tax=Shewanella TaxID=22 RepID=UPI0021D7F6F6|nr:MULTISPECIES: RNase E specificity factor CsrD [unclassified Shewanella]MCU7975095.1 RNase E specificity factor CsrD [Shewanella sp. SW36]MCU7990484.1 RNase E specificity factor CsrD [Shewanella sp. SW1]MCU8016152.1 RNase E specificity factor CsrD [Shewanella sp. SM72]MCU8051689.1 RNase E specificity factor CsrD [Shewanella sp. SM43]
MKFTRMLTTKLTSFWLMSLAAIAFVFLLSAMMSFVQLTYKFQQQKVAELETMLVDQFQHQPDWELEAWLPPMLLAYNAVNFRLTLKDEVLFAYEGNLSTQNAMVYDHVLEPTSGLRMQLTLTQPFEHYTFSWYEILILLVGILAVAALVRFGYLWFSQQLDGIEELALRSRLILQGKHEQALATPGNGKPRLINRALTKLLEELQDAQKERGRFDKFIRSNTFLDAETRIGNRLFLNNRLDALSHNQAMLAHGVIYLLEMDDLDLLQQSQGEAVTKELLNSTVNAISQLLQTQANSIFARRSHNQFAIVVPQISLIEADQFASKLLKICLSQPLPDVENSDNFFHLGCAYFTAGDNAAQLIEEADMALRAAQLQGNSNWFMYDKGAIDEEFAKGSVRWRSFLENALVQRRFFPFSQPIIDSDGNEHHKEIFTRARDNQGALIRATLFIPMANKCGLMPQVERQIIERVLLLLSNELADGISNAQTVKKSAPQIYSINLSLDSLMSRAFTQWLKTTLLEYRHLTTRLIFEVSEDIVIQHQEKLQPKLDMIRKMGARLCVDHVGQQVVGTYYIRECHFDLIKLHRSIVRHIHLRPENQLFIRSLIGGLYRTEVQVCAEGVEVFEEWQTLQILGVGAAQGMYFSEPIEAK